jgi:hypothetical protein
MNESNFGYYTSVSFTVYKLTVYSLDTKMYEGVVKVKVKVKCSHYRPRGWVAV